MLVPTGTGRRASLLLQQMESVIYVTKQLGHGSSQVTVDP